MVLLVLLFVMVWFNLVLFYISSVLVVCYYVFLLFTIVYIIYLMIMHGIYLIITNGLLSIKSTVVNLICCNCLT